MNFLNFQSTTKHVEGFSELFLDRGSTPRSSTFALRSFSAGGLRPHPKSTLGFGGRSPVLSIGHFPARALRSFSVGGTIFS